MARSAVSMSCASLSGAAALSATLACAVFLRVNPAMTDRRRFLAASLAAAATTAASRSARAGSAAPAGKRPRVVSTWDFGVAANQAAWQVLSKGGNVLDAVEAGARVPEADPKNH